MSETEDARLPAWYVARERRALPLLMLDGERLVDHEVAGRGSGRVGLLVLTNQRLLHLYFRRILRRMAKFELAYERIDWVVVSRRFGGKQLEVQYDDRSRRVHLIVLVGRERTLELAETIRDEAAQNARRSIPVTR